MLYQRDTNNNIVFVSDGLTQMMQYRRKFKLKVVNIGVKMFSKNRDLKSPAKFRLLQEGLELLLPYMSENRKIQVSKEVFTRFLEVGSFTYEELREKVGTDKFDGKENGSAVMMYGDLYATIWVGVNNVSLMINKEEIKSFKFLIQ